LFLDKRPSRLPRSVVLDLSGDDVQRHEDQDADGSDETGVGIDAARDE
jgi:hypothetical protein